MKAREASVVTAKKRHKKQGESNASTQEVSVSTWTPPPPTGAAPSAAEAAAVFSQMPAPDVRSEKFLDGALAVMEREGWEQASIERIAASTGVGLKELLDVYPSRDHIARAAIDRVLERLPAEFTDEVDDRSTLRDRLYSAVAHELRMMAPYRRFMGDLVRASLSPFSQAAALQVPLVTRYLAFIAEQIRVARAREEISSWAPAAAAASAFWLVHLRIVSYWLNDASPDHQQTHAVADRWIRQFVLALGGRSGADTNVPAGAAV
jgi:AcrR family transcriptional regulator